MIDPKIAQLTAVNEALVVLDYGMASRDALPGDQFILEAYHALVSARRKLTDKPWPDIPHPKSDSRQFAVWHFAKQEEQQKDGRQ